MYPVLLSDKYQRNKSIPERQRLLDRKQGLLDVINDCREQRHIPAPLFPRDRTQTVQHDSEKKSLEQIYIEELNQIVKMLEPPKMPEPPRCDPAEKLPFDLMVEITRLSVRSVTRREQYFNTEISLELLLSLILVSNRWRWSILNSPILWTHIDLDDYNEKQDASIKIFLALALARDAPLTISISADNLTAEACSVITSISDRIATINVIPSIHPMRTSAGKYIDIQIALEKLIEITRYPLLNRIYLGNPSQLENSILSDIRAAVPNLRTLKYLVCDRKWDMSKLESWTLIEALYGWSQSDSPHLVNHVLVLCKSIQIHEEGQHLQVGSVGFVSAGNATLPLTGFRSTGRITVAPRFINRLQELIRLETGVTANDFLELAQALSHLKKLEHLSLWIHCANEEAMQMLESSTTKTFTPNRNVKNLQYLTNWDYARLEISILSPSNHLVVSLLGRLLPSIRDLRLLRVNDIQAVLEWAAGDYFPDLVSLNYDLGISDMMMPQGRALSPSIQFLTAHVTSLDPHVLLGWNIRDLTILIISHEDKSRIVALPGPEACPNLWRLKVFAVHRVDFVPINNSHLRQLTLGSTMDEVCAAFCVHLARNPESLPHLRSLTFEESVEIDIVFITLEQRNVWAQGVSRITTLTLAGPPSSRYSLSLRDLIDGNLSRRPLNYELSLLGNLEEYNDLNM